MNKKNNVEERCRKILEDYGGTVADKARTILFEDPALNNLRSPLKFISKNWRDPLTPALMSLSCKAVGGSSDETYEAAIAISLMHLTFYIWDDIIDKAAFKSFKPTILGKLGVDASLIIGGIASAKAFTILNQMEINRVKHQTVTKLIWDLWAKIARTEIVFQRLRGQEGFSCRKKFWKIKTEATDTETCLRIGAIIGNGSESEIDNLGKYGLYLGIILELWKDFRVSANLTLELAEKIKSRTLPYSLLWARGRSEKLRRKLDSLTDKNTIEPTSIKEIVEDMLATRALENTAKNIRKYTKKAKEELDYLNENNATRTLRSLIDIQPRLFSESLSTLEAHKR